MTQNKKNRYSDEEKWSAFKAPLEEWMTANAEGDEETLWAIDNANSQIKRGNRSVEMRPKCVKALKVEFAELDFATWRTERLDKTILKKMRKDAKANRQVHIAYFRDSNRVFTFTKEKVMYQIVDEKVYAEREMAADLTFFKKMHGLGLNWLNPDLKVFVAPLEDDEEE
tara:strand:- start:308 stop:814 length:507 start_codon:yes stop_codon:yes gene_type:complete